MDLVHTSKPDFKCHIPRKQIPGLNKLFSMKAFGDNNETIKILSGRDEEFFVDVVNTTTGETKTHRTCTYKSYSF